MGCSTGSSAGFGPLEDLVDVARPLGGTQVGDIHAVGHETPGLSHILPQRSTFPDRLSLSVHELARAALRWLISIVLAASINDARRLHLSCHRSRSPPSKLAGLSYLYDVEDRIPSSRRPLRAPSFLRISHWPVPKAGSQRTATRDTPRRRFPETAAGVLLNRSGPLTSQSSDVSTRAEKGSPQTPEATGSSASTMTIGIVRVALRGDVSHGSVVGGHDDIDLRAASALQRDSGDCFWIAIRDAHRHVIAIARPVNITQLAERLDTWPSEGPGCFGAEPVLSENTNVLDLARADCALGGERRREEAEGYAPTRTFAGPSFDHLIRPLQE